MSVHGVEQWVYREFASQQLRHVRINAICIMGRGPDSDEDVVPSSC